MVMLRYSEIWVASFALLQYLYCKERAIAMRQLSHVVPYQFYLQHVSIPESESPDPFAQFCPSYGPLAQVSCTRYKED